MSYLQLSLGERIEWTLWRMESPRRASKGMVMEKNLTQKPVLVFDGDDTLWETMPLYSAAKRRLFSTYAA